jgi:16S rRNA (cytosine1402-N4)-methyltransferase
MHKPVLLKEVIEILNPKPGEFFIDGTLGSAGHAIEIIKRISPNGIFLGIDWDNESIERAKSKVTSQKSKVILVHGNYADLPEILKKHNLTKADGLLLDLGFSSEQLGLGRPASAEASAGKGFSFLKNEPLDMRYNQNQGESASVVVNYHGEKELADIFFKYGEERFSRRIAKNIIEERKRTPIKTTFDLIEVIKKAVPRNYEKGRLHPATRIFQALRIYVNDELGNLEKLLKNIDKIIKNKGRLAIISYHSLEDRLVKNYFKQLAKQGKAEILTNPEGKPLVSYGARKPIRPTNEEVQANPRSRSAKLRVIILR